MQAAKKYVRSAATKHEVQCYPPLKYFTLVKGYAVLNQESRSAVATLAIKCFFDQLPAEELRRYAAAAKEIPDKNQ